MEGPRPAGTRGRAGPVSTPSHPSEASLTSADQASVAALDEWDDLLVSVKVELASPLTPYALLVHDHFFERKKVELTRWWLNLIEANVDSFLRGLGYDFDAVPFHYIDQPPRSMPAILKNLQMIRFLLKASSNSTETSSLSMRQHLQVGLVEPLKKTVYSRIDEYAHSVTLFIWHECNSLLGLHLADPRLPSNFAAVSVRQRHVGILDPAGRALVPQADLSLLKSQLEQRATTVPENRRTLLLSLLGDLHYINEMKRLEQDFFSPTTSESPQPQKKTAPSDIVPVTGLIVGKLHRIENELKTVVDHWTRRGLH